MSDSERYIRQEVGRYRGKRALNLIKAITIILIGGIGISAALTGTIWSTKDGSIPPDSILAPLGKEGATLAAAGICLAILLIGVIWAIGLIRDLTSGSKAYAEELKQSQGNITDFY